ncbi:flagellar type III secretion system pore protein FliP [Geobacter sulfurreducens]|jgi:flagellar biosynthetic protein FliP|uniref:Flagellar biosynthetic protein FliP n=1 Tax=Geobacter sulfurreducens (strain ATCC 51573 / DSM 12127 / PCA) TaxID=243231 RepID=Q3V8D2_GEOSL|nr:flagellar type III secretion system pore protein FliP [Geobacter sulfurreducens]AAR33755.1 flagellar biogenesis protein FliP [Geobacter sulfurreducens PCA]ADI83255.1 flagellar biogenesis protein FliP [Geobacter sulfurreducens KN400]AJY70147.1 flagellar biosynthesis protein flip [Geobacter sulfurreducens]QVW35680.1 flagellar type III secretion system pore protein FliP [Geobacter sulfurreducens]UAC04504.1 flagellar type III secretion system pore protein FliP [Geobacter sulfurreducens]
MDGVPIFKRIPFIALCVILLTASLAAAAEPLALPSVSIGVGKATKPGDVSVVLQIFFLMTVLSLAPGLLMMTTSFTRIAVVLSFLRHAIGTQQAPPNQIIIALSLFLTFFVMAPVWQQVNTQAIQPYRAAQITQDEALKRAVAPMRKFMLSQTREKDLALFLNLSKLPRPRTADDIPTLTLIPAFMISELRTAFQIGFLIFIPFLVVDMVVASVLMSMGMMMLPPVMISLPFKILLFVLVDGWGLVIGSLIKSFG